MASTGFWPVKSRLKDVIDYAENPDKTIDKRFMDDDLWATLSYAENEQKTDQKMYVSAINCPKQRTYQCMMDTKRRFGKLGGNVAYHGYQSFVTGEVTPEEAHQIGLETARRMWGEEYEIVVTTHLNTDNIHNHIIINSVSFKAGRKFENHIRDHIRLREISDEVCREHGKSVIPFSHFYGNKKAHWIHQSGQLTHRDILRKDVDEAISKCSTFQAMERYLKGLGYRFERDFRYQYPSVKAEGWKRAVRLESLGEEYSKDSIRQKMIENQRKPELFMVVVPSRKRKPLLELEYNLHRAERMDSVTLLFQIFVELLQLCTVNHPDRQSNCPLSPAMRAEVRRLDRYLEEYRLLCDNAIESPQDFVKWREGLDSKIAALEQKRYSLRCKLRRVNSPEEETDLKDRCKAITKKITPLRKQKKIADRIEEHIPKIRELMEQERQMESGEERKRDSKDKQSR